MKVQIFDGDQPSHSGCVFVGNPTAAFLEGAAPTARRGALAQTATDASQHERAQSGGTLRTGGLDGLGGPDSSGGPDSLGGPNAVTGITRTALALAADALLSGYSWRGGSVDFAFPDAAGDYRIGYPASAPLRDFAPFNAAQQTAARALFDSVADVTDLALSERSEKADTTAQIRLAQSDAARTAYAYYPGPMPESGDIWVHNGIPDWAGGPIFADPQPGNYAWHSLIHEIGHALGLKHGHQPGGTSRAVLPGAYDSMEFSVMTYRSYVGAPSETYRNGYWDFAQSLMVLDIAALQALYGADFRTRSGDTVYAIDPESGSLLVDGAVESTPGANVVFRTIWDGGGRDTYDFSIYDSDLRIDLVPGRYVDLDRGGAAQRADLGDGVAARGHLFNALAPGGDRRALIENALGGSGDDEIFGNKAANRLEGGAGDDRIWGGVGADTLLGGEADDKLFGQSGSDVLFGGAGRNVLVGGAGADVFVFELESGRQVLRDAGFEDAIDLPDGIGLADLVAVERGDVRLLHPLGSMRLVDVTLGELDAFSFI
ncbi:MAG: M10 family metallopeptidase C-terminal domain-containing protein [Pseudomonadota bacterium]